MSDPRNVAHGKKVAQEKHHEHAKSVPDGERKFNKTKQPAGAAAAENAALPAATETAKAAPGELEKSVAVLSKLKDMEFHSRANIEALAELMLTIEDELRQREFSEPIGGLYSAQDGFHSKIVALIESYEAKCESLRQPA
jgi:hypothetical protein